VVGGRRGLVGHSNQMIDDSSYAMFDRKRLSCPADD
jgi:hypothetical protein